MSAGCLPFDLKRIPSFMASSVAVKAEPTISAPPSPVAPASSKLTRLLRSKSETNVKTSSCSISSTASLSGAHALRRSSSDRRHCVPSHRRYKRVLREAPSMGDENPHVVHKFSTEFPEIGLREGLGASLVAGVECLWQCAALPYEVSRSTILKKRLDVTVDPSNWARAPATRPTISFGRDVEVIEFDRRQKVKKKNLFTHRIRLTSDEGASDMAATGDSEKLDLQSCSSRKKEAPGQSNFDAALLETVQRTALVTRSTDLGPPTNELACDSEL